MPCQGGPTDGGGEPQSEWRDWQVGGQLDGGGVCLVGVDGEQGAGGGEDGHGGGGDQHFAGCARVGGVGVPGAGPQVPWRGGRIYHVAHRTAGYRRGHPVAYAMPAVHGSWSDDDDEVAAVVARLRSGRAVSAARAGRAVFSAEELIVSVLGMRETMRPDEYLHCLNRRSVYVACRRVSTISRDDAWRAGL